MHPNFGSAYATPSSRLTDAHYVKLNLLNRWTWERFQRLANYLKLTPYELGSIACVPHEVVERWKLRSVIPLSAAQGAYSIALVLTVLEGHLIGDLYHDVIQNPFPSIP